MRSSTSPAALALLALPMAVSARPRCHPVYPVSSPSVSSHPVGYNVSSHVVPSASGSASAYPASSASASASLSSASQPASYSVSASASGPASYSVLSASASISSASSASAPSVSSASYSASSVSVSSASASYSGSASAPYSVSASAPYSASAPVSYSASASASASNSASASASASNSASYSASASASASASNSASASAAYPTSSSPATSYPVSDLGPAFCLINDAVISAMNKAPEATAFCSSYLSIPTQTTTVTATQTPIAITITVPATITGEDRITDVATATSTASTDVTETLTVTVPSTVTVTSTTSTAVLTCLNGAYTASEPVGTVPAVDKRTIAVATPTCLPTNWASAAVSRACSCLSVAPKTVTTTTTQTLEPGVTTATQTTVLTPTVTATETAVVTSTSTHTETATVTEGTVTLTAYAQATSIAASGLHYRRWEHGYDANLDAPGYTVNDFKGRTPLGAGTLRSPTFRGNGNTLRLATTEAYPFTENIPAAQAAIMMQGFFVARQTGTYTFWSGANDIDNWGYLWTGAPALGDWRDDNTAFKAVRTGSKGQYSGGISYLTLRAGDAVPVAWLWANGGGDAASFLGIRGPNGVATIDGSDSFVLPCDDGVFH